MKKLLKNVFIKFMFSKRATKIEKIFTVNLTLCSKSYKDFVKFCGLLRKHKLYYRKYGTDLGLMHLQGIS